MISFADFLNHIVPVESCVFFYVRADIDASLIMAALVPFFKALEEGILIHLDCLRSDDNPTGAILIRGCIFSVAGDMPQSNFDCACKGVGATKPCRHLTLSKPQLVDATLEECTLYTRVDEKHHSEIAETRALPPSQRAAAETEYGILADTNTAVIDGLSINTPQQYNQCLLHAEKGLGTHSHPLPRLYLWLLHIAAAAPPRFTPIIGVFPRSFHIDHRTRPR